MSKSWILDRDFCSSLLISTDPVTKIGNRKDGVCLQLHGQVSKQPKHCRSAMLDPKCWAFRCVSGSLLLRLYGNFQVARLLLDTQKLPSCRDNIVIESLWFFLAWLKACQWPTKNYSLQNIEISRFILEKGRQYRESPTKHAVGHSQPFTMVDTFPTIVQGLSMTNKVLFLSKTSSQGCL